MDEIIKNIYAKFSNNKILLKTFIILSTVISAIFWGIAFFKYFNQNQGGEFEAALLNNFVTFLLFAILFLLLLFAIEEKEDRLILWLKKHEYTKEYKNKHLYLLYIIYNFNNSFTEKELIDIIKKNNPELFANWGYFTDLKSKNEFWLKHEEKNNIAEYKPAIEYGKWGKISITEKWIALLQKKDILKNEDSETSSEWQK